ncbi:tyrosine-type recombinase/integrase [Nocardiopsis salina]|uniref:tyrosine-type recombinase/integrase n=1 Tax=Nocardiopsis salina TaxID=245836 RepID=UPI000687C27E|nr:site-specific integrase [Nocardiopsis salina]
MSTRANYRERATAARKAKRTPPGRWKVRYYDPAGRERAETFQKEPQAQARRAELETQLGQGTYRDPRSGRVKFADVAETWFAAQHDLKRSTKNGYRDHLDLYVLPQWGGVAVADIRRDDVVAWVGELIDSPGVNGGGLGSSQVRRIHGVLSLVLGAAVESNKIAVNPAKGVKLPRLPEKDHIYLKDNEVEALATAAGEYRPFVLLLAYTGLRYGEAAAVRVRSVDLERRRVRVIESFGRDGGEVYVDTPKTHERRTVPIPPFLVEELGALVASRSPDSWVFTSPQGGPLRYDNFRRRVFGPAVVAAGLAAQGVTAHKLRHTAASLAIASGADVKVVQTMLGHKTATMTLDTYGHLFPDRLDDVAEKMSARRTAALREAA